MLLPRHEDTMPSRVLVPVMRTLICWANFGVYTGPVILENFHGRVDMKVLCAKS